MSRRHGFLRPGALLAVVVVAGVVVFATPSAKAAVPPESWLTWTKQSPPAAAPPVCDEGRAVEGCSRDRVMAYFPPLKKVILYTVRYTPVEPYAEPAVWTWDGLDWRDETPSGDNCDAPPAITPPPAIPCMPRARSRPTMAFDPASQRLVLFGGNYEESWQAQEDDPCDLHDLGCARSGTILNDTWTYGCDPGPPSCSWRRENPPAAPPGRMSSAMAYDGRQLVMFGGGGSLDPYMADMWAWDGATWVPRQSGPLGRSGHRMVFDAARGNVVLFGGITKGNVAGNLFDYGRDADDTWTWDGAAWMLRVRDSIVPSPPELDVPRPPARNSHAFAYHPALERVVLFGGYRGGSLGGAWYGDTWMWDGAAWAQFDPQSSFPKPPAPNEDESYDPPPLMASADVTGSLVLLDDMDTWHFGPPPLTLTPDPIAAGGSSVAVARVTDLHGEDINDATVTLQAYSGGTERALPATSVGDGRYQATVPGIGQGAPARQRISATADRGVVSSSGVLDEIVSDLPALHRLSPDHGWAHGGTEVRITGVRLDTTTAVHFGDKTAAFQVHSPTTITAISPPHAVGEVDVVLTGPGGSTAATPASKFSYFSGSAVTTGELNTARVNHTATVLADGRVLVVGGQYQIGHTEALRSAEVYDPDARRWSPVRPAGTARYRHTATLLEDGTVLVVGGFGSPVEGVADPPVMDSAEIYDPGSDSWTPVPPPSSCSPASSCVARVAHSATSLPGGKVLVAGGTVEVAPTMLGGVTVEPGGTREVASSQIFDPGTRTWSAAASLGTGRGHHAATLVGSKVLVAGGLNFDRDGPLWGVPGVVPDPDYVGGALASAELYDPSTDTWAPTGSLVNARGPGVTATGLAGGDVLVTGGCSCGRGERYRTGMWRPTGPFGVTDAGTPVALADGRVAMLGGKNTGSPAPRDTILVYDPADDSWRRDYHLAVPRAGLTASLLADGAVLVVGGADGAGTALTSSEIYDPDSPQDLLAPTVTKVDPPSGPTSGGTRVSITGSNFVAPLTVRFGDVPATVEEVVSESELVVSAPPQFQGEVPVTVHRAGLAGVASSSATFTYGSGAWRPIASPGGARLNHTATPLPDGKVLVAGGTQDYFLWAARRTTYHDGISTENDVGYRKTADSPPFVQSDEGRRIFGENIPDPAGAVEPNATTRIVEVISETEVRLSLPASATGTGLSFTIDHSDCERVGQVEGVNCTTGRPHPDASLRSALVYDPATESWNAAASLAHGRQSHTATALADGRVLVAGGIDGLGNAMRSAEIYNPTARTWTATPDMNVGRLSHTATLLADGRVLAVGGAPSEAARSQALSSAEIYDPAADSWTSTPALPSGHVNHTAVLLAGPGCGPRCGQVLVAGGMAAGDGSTKGDASAKADLFDPATFTWSAQPAMTVGRLGHSSVQLAGGKVLVAGGFIADGVTTSSVELYDPARGTWAPTGSMRRPDANASAVLLDDGTVLVAGGGATYPVGITTNRAVAQVYEPSTGRWNLTSPLAHPRAAHTLTLLDTGSVLVAGGYGSASSIGPPYTFPATDELYVPAPVLTGITPPAGPLVGGTLTTITGAGLGEVTSLGFGDTNVASTPCPAAPTAPCFTVDSPTQITAVTPPHARGRVPISADGPGGTSRRLSTAPAGGLVARFAYLEEPGAVALVAEATSPTDVRLTLRAPDDGGGEPATIYVVKQSFTEIMTQADFDAATAFVLPPFSPAAVGDELRVDIADLAPATTYHYAVRAVNLAGLSGPISGDVSVATPPAPLRAGSCPAIPDTSGGIRYPSGYSLVGLPAGTSLGSASPLYAWFDLGAGGAYSTATSTEAGRGYWAWSACPRVVQLPATGAASARFALGGYHASMVGNPSASAPATVAGHDFAAAWDPSLNAGAGGYHISAYREPQTLAVGAGTWLFSYVPTEIRIDAAS